MRKLITFTFSLVSLVVFGQSSDKNYIKTVTARQASTSSVINSNSKDATQQTIEYVDGLGRPLQSVVRWGSGAGTDLISQPDYDEFGRQTKSYLPIVTGQSSGNYTSFDESFYETTLDFTAGDASSAYSEAVFEPSPLNRPVTQLGPGEAWRNATPLLIASFEDEEENNSGGATIWITLFGNVQAGQTITVSFRAREQTGADAEVDIYNNEIKLPNASQNSFSGSFVTYSISAEIQSSGNIRLRLNEANNKDFYVSDIVASVHDSRKGVSTVYQTNTLNEVNRWYIDTEGYPTFSTAYTENELFKTVTIDEDGNEMAEFSDKRGRVLMKESYTGGEWAQTYYIYDDSDNLRYVLPPEFIAWVDINGVNQSGGLFTAEDLTLSPGADYENYYYGPAGIVTLAPGFTHNATADGGLTIQPGRALADIEVYRHAIYEYCFEYSYDDRNRMILKKVPGAEPIHMVYDQWNRLVLTQDGNQREANEWLFTKYDELNRPVLTGLKVINGALQTIRDDVMNAANRSETYDGGPLEGYSNSAYPSSGVSANDLLTVTYYDNYDFVPDTDLAGTSYQRVYTTSDQWHMATPTTQNNNVRGLVTGSLARGVGSDFIATITYYDDKHRPIQVVTENHLSSWKDIVSNQYDFVGNIRKTQTEHFDGSTTTVKRRFEYDHMDRVTHIWHEINTEGEVLVAMNEYNKIGELERKDLHYDGTNTSPTQGDFEQNMDYEYNIRGWLKKVNAPSLTGGDLFGMELFYIDNPLESSKTNFNGNISAMRWSNYDVVAENIDQRSYSFDYDGLNRLTNANHFRNTNTSHAEYDVDIPLYDLNGNIKSLSRKGKNGDNMDNLTYSYVGNQLTKVTDGGNAEGFDNGFSSTGIDYTYDANGNMTSDANKGITSIEYSHLNLPTKVTFDANNYIEYQYDAAGIKLSQIVYEDGNIVKATDYAGEFIYETVGTGTRELQLIQHEEGRVIPLESSHPEFISGSKEHDYQYHLKDHLGNVRMTFATTPETYTETATFEDVNQTAEGAFFGNYNPRVLHPAGGQGVRLNSSTPAGTYVVLSIDKGDKVDLSVDGYYAGGTGYSSPITAAAMESALSTSLSGAPALEGLTSAAIDNGIGAAIAALGVGGSSNDSQPGAYLNYLIFDRDMNYQGIAGYVQIPTAANGSEQPMTIPTITADRQGYLVAYLSNESNTTNWVYFDDFTVTHDKTNVVSTQDYYPFGLEFNSYSRTASTENRMNTFQDQEYEEETGWVKFKWRNHDPAIGRFISIDPLSEKYVYNSPYAFSENKVIAHFELEGLEAVTAKYNYKNLENNYERDGQSIVNSQNGLDWMRGKGMNTCAIRMCYSFNLSGYTVPSSQETPADVKIQNGRDGDVGNFILTAEGMNNYLNDLESPTFSFENLDNPEAVNEAIEKLKGLKNLNGIIVFVAGDEKEYGATGHVDLLYNDSWGDPSMYGFPWYRNNDLDDYLNNRRKALLSIYIWILQNQQSDDDTDDETDDDTEDEEE